MRWALSVTAIGAAAVHVGLWGLFGPFASVLFWGGVCLWVGLTLLDTDQ